MTQSCLVRQGVQRLGDVGLCGRAGVGAADAMMWTYSTRSTAAPHPPKTVAQVERLAARWPQAATNLVEDKANGTAVIDSLRKKVVGVTR